MSWVRKRPWYVLAVALLLLIIAGSACSGGIYLWANHHLHAGQEALAHHRLSPAREHLRLYLTVWPNDALAHFLAGRAARRDLDFREAKKHFRECQRLAGSAFPVSMEETLMRVQQGELDGMDKNLLRLVDKGHPDSPLILEALVEGYMQVHRLPDAVACLERWQQLEEGNMYFYFLRGSIRERIPNLEPAASDYRKVLELNPDYQEARLRLSRMLLELHECEEALVHLRQLRDLQPENNMVSVFMARCYLDLDRPQEARVALDEVLGRDASFAPALLVGAQLAMQEGDTEHAESLLRQALAVDSNEREANFLLSQCLRQRGKVAEAEQQTAKFKSIEADWKAVQELVTMKIGAAPHDPELRYQVGRLLLRLGEKKAAVEWFYRTLALDPDHAPTHQALAEYYQEIGNTRQAASHRAHLSKTQSSKPETTPKS